LFAVGNFIGMRLVRATDLRGFLRAFRYGSLVALSIGFRHGVRRFPGIQSSWTGDNVFPTALAETERERRARLPMELSEAVESWVLRLTGDRKSVFEFALSRAGLYSDMIRTKLTERGMPEELLYLALIESDFYTDARSRVLATGMWQFMEPTARRYGLRIDTCVDERYNPVRATDAALDHLNDLYEEYGSQYLAAAAYNAGAVRVSDVLGRYTDGRNGDDSLYWEIVDHLPSETGQLCAEAPRCHVPRKISGAVRPRREAGGSLRIRLRLVSGGCGPR
jgi:hypothetical protein